LEEAGKDTSKFDHLVPTIVKPISRDNYADDTTTTTVSRTTTTTATTSTTTTTT